MADKDVVMNKQRQIGLKAREKEPPDFSALLLNVGQDQDKIAFAEIFQHFAPRVKSYMLKLGNVDEIAEELAQQTLLKVWRKAQLFDPGKAAASTWIFRIARNLRIDTLRKHKHFFDDDYDLEGIVDEQEDVEDKVSREQKSHNITLALSALPQEQTRIIRLSFYDGLSHSEIANQLGIPLGTVKSRIRLAFGHLRKNLHLESGEMV